MGWAFIYHKNVQCLCINSTETLVIFVGWAFTIWRKFLMVENFDESGLGNV